MESLETVTFLIKSASEAPRDGEIWFLISKRSFDAIVTYRDTVAEAEDYIIVDEADADSSATSTGPKPSSLPSMKSASSLQLPIDNASLIIDTEYGPRLKQGLVAPNDYVAVPEKSFLRLKELFGFKGPELSRDVIELPSKSCVVDVYRLDAIVRVVGAENSQSAVDTMFVTDVSRYNNLDELHTWSAAAPVRGGAPWPKELVRLWIRGPCLPQREAGRAEEWTLERTDVDEEGWRLIRFDKSEGLTLFDSTTTINEMLHYFSPRADHFLELLIEKRSDTQSPWPRAHSEAAWKRALQVNDKVDAQDKKRVWYDSTIMSVCLVTNSVVVRFSGWGAKFDEKISLSSSKLAPRFSRVAEWRSKLQLFDLVDVCTYNTDKKRMWSPAVISEFGSGENVGKLFCISENGGSWIDTEHENLQLFQSHTTSKCSHLQETLATQQRLRQAKSQSLAIHRPVHGHVRQPLAASSSVLADASSKAKIVSQSNNIKSLPSSSSFVFSLSDSRQNDRERPASSFSNQANRCQPALLWSRPASIVRRSYQPGCVGITNASTNDCYLNSILQCLNSCPTLHSLFTSGVYLNQINSTALRGTGGAVAKALAAVMSHMSKGGGHPASSVAVKREMAKKYSTYMNSNQEDAQEFLLHILDVLDEDLGDRGSAAASARAVIPVPEEDVNDEERADLQWSNSFVQNQSIMTSLLYGQLRSRVTCVVCGLQSTTFDPYNNLQLDIPPSQASCSLGELLGNYFREQDMSAEERFMCPRCGRKQLCRKKLDLWSVPQYLIIQLKRFEMFISVAGFTQSRKLINRIRIPTRLATLSANCPNGAGNYNLIAMCSHMGSSLQSGHFTAQCRNPVSGSAEWATISDQEVEVIDISRHVEKEDVQRDAYLLFFELENII